VLVGAQPGQPRFHAVEGLTLGEALPLLGAPRLGGEEFLGTGAHFRRRQQLPHGEEPGVFEVGMAALVGDGELAQPVDLVTPQVDAHRVVSGGRVNIDDRAPHRELAARFDLVFAAIPHRDEPFDQLVAVEAGSGVHDDRLNGLHMRPEALHEGSDGGDHDVGQVLATDPQPPHDPEPAAHRLGRGRHPLEGQRLPRGEQLDGVGAEVLPQISGDSFGLGARRHRQ
jgi:hypothetical protein